MLESTHRLIEDFVRKQLSKNDKGAHTFDHSRRVYALSMRIGQGSGADLKVLGAAALLHDIGRSKEDATGISHSILSGEMSQEFLKDMGFNDDEIDKVVDAIRTHRFSEGIEPTSMEGQVLSDADKLDAMGAIGVFRAIAQANSTGGGIKAFLEHADEKLLRLKDLMYTDGARIVAEERHSTLESFVMQLREELKLE